MLDLFRIAGGDGFAVIALDRLSLGTAQGRAGDGNVRVRQRAGARNVSFLGTGYET